MMQRKESAIIALIIFIINSYYSLNTNFQISCQMFYTVIISHSVQHYQLNFSNCISQVRKLKLK